MNEAVYDRRKDDWVRLPRTLVMTVAAGLILMVPTSVFFGIWWMSNLADRVESTAHSMTELSLAIKQRDIQIDARFLAQDIRDRAADNDMIRLQSKMDYMLRETEADTQHVQQQNPRVGK